MVIVKSQVKDLLNNFLRHQKNERSHYALVSVSGVDNALAANSSGL